MAHLSIGMWVRRLIGIAPGAHLSCGRSCRQSPRGASRSEGLVVRKHVPDRARQLARHDDRRDLRTALGAVAIAGALIELAVVPRAAGVLGCLDQRPAQIPWPILLHRPAPVALA